MSTRKTLANNPFRQRGAIGLWGVLTLMLAVLFTALAVDSGRLFMQRRQLQTVADIAAIQAARQMGCGISLGSVQTAAQTAAANNGFTGSLTANPNVVELGNVSTVGGIRQFSAGAGQEAVHVKATQEVPASLVAGGLWGGIVTLRAEAVASADPPIAGFSIGSFAASMNSDDSTLLNGVLSDLLGASVNLSLASYQGLAGTKVTIKNLLAASSGVGSVDTLLTTNMQLGEMLSLVATAVSSSGTADARAVTASQQLASAAVSNVSLTLGDVLSVATPDKNAAAEAGVNVLSLITAAAIAANGQHTLTLPLAVSVPPIASINAQITFLEPPQLAIGPAADASGNICTSVTTAQISAQAGVSANVVLATIDLLLKLQVAQGSAGLLSISDDGGSAQVVIDATPGIASMTLTNTAGTGPARISLAGLPLADLSLNLPIQPPSAQQLTFDVAHPVADNLPTTQTISSPLGASLQNALNQSSAISVTVLSALNLALVNTVVSTIVSPLLGQIGKGLLDPLLALLGIRVGGMDVTLDDVQIHQPKSLEI